LIILTKSSYQRCKALEKARSNCISLKSNWLSIALLFAFCQDITRKRLDTGLSRSIFVKINFLCFFFRYQFFLQIKQDIAQSRLPVPFNLLAQLCAYAVQCKYFGSASSFVENDTA